MAQRYNPPCLVYRSRINLSIYEMQDPNSARCDGWNIKAGWDWPWEHKAQMSTQAISLHETQYRTLILAHQPARFWDTNGCTGLVDMAKCELPESTGCLTIKAKSFKVQIHGVTTTKFWPSGLFFAKDGCGRSKRSRITVNRTGCKRPIRHPTTLSDLLFGFAAAQLQWERAIPRQTRIVGVTLHVTRYIICISLTVASSPWRIT